MLRRFAEYRDLEGAFQRRAVTERAKGILMERHASRRGAGVPADPGSRTRSDATLADTAQLVVDGELFTDAL